MLWFYSMISNFQMQFDPLKCNPPNIHFLPYIHYIHISIWFYIYNFHNDWLCKLQGLFGDNKIATWAKILSFSWIGAQYLLVYAPFPHHPPPPDLESIEFCIFYIHLLHVIHTHTYIDIQIVYSSTTHYHPHTHSAHGTIKTNKKFVTLFGFVTNSTLLLNLEYY